MAFDTNGGLQTNVHVVKAEVFDSLVHHQDAEKEVC